MYIESIMQHAEPLMPAMVVPEYCPDHYYPGGVRWNQKRSGHGGGLRRGRVLVMFLLFGSFLDLLAIFRQKIITEGDAKAFLGGKGWMRGTILHYFHFSSYNRLQDWKNWEWRIGISVD